MQLPFQQLSTLRSIRLVRACINPEPAAAATASEHASDDGSAGADAEPEGDLPAHPSGLTALTALTKLDLTACRISLTGLGLCSILLHLRLQLVSVPAGSTSLGAALAVELPQLKCLTAHFTSSKKQTVSI